MGSFIDEPDTVKPTPPPPKLEEVGAEKTGAGKRKPYKPAMFASDEELKLGIAGKLGV
jgi:hypothetical protein